MTLSGTITASPNLNGTIAELFPPIYANTKSILFDGGPDATPVDFLLTGPLMGTTDIGRRVRVSLSIWIKATSLATQGCFYGIGTSGDGQRLQVTTDGRVLWHRNDAAGTGLIQSAIGSIVVGQWYHLAFTYNRSSPITGTKIYIDGALARSGSATGGLSRATIVPAIGCQDGGSAPNGSGAFSGNIDEPSFWDRELSAAEVLTLYNGGKAPSLEGMSGLICWYRMGDDDADSTDSADAAARIFDQVGSNNATPVNMVAGNIVEDAPS